MYALSFIQVCTLAVEALTWRTACMCIFLVDHARNYNRSFSDLKTYEEMSVPSGLDLVQERLLEFDYNR